MGKQPLIKAAPPLIAAMAHYLSYIFCLSDMCGCEGEAVCVCVLHMQFTWLEKDHLAQITAIDI